MGLTKLTINNIFLSIEVFIDCNTYQLRVNNIFLDISNGYNSYTGKYDKLVTNVNGTPYDNIINGIISNNSNTINFDIPSCSFNLQTCNNQSSTPVDQQCKPLVNTINSYMNKSLFPTVDLSQNINVINILKIFAEHHKFRFRNVLFGQIL